ncbi:MAG TPA: DUF58 domain-containing protein [Micromonosporaceae bacterium]|nr:DUF58 domain-containing protein [Micromonosporaceae bacterium]
MITWRAPALLLALGIPTVAVTTALGVSPWLPLAIVLGVVLLLILADLLIAAPAGEVTLRRSGPTQVRLGDRVTVTLSVTNDSVRLLRALVRDAWEPSAGAAPPYAHPVDVEPGASTTIETSLTPTRRGDRSAVRVTIRSYGPFALAYRQTSRRRSAAITPPWTLTVLPEFRSRRLLPEKLSRLRVIDGQVVTRGRGQGGEFDSLRDYVIGDDPRSIDWRGSARRDHLVVKQWRPERDRRVLCVLDTGRTSAGRIGTAADPLNADTTGEPRLDIAIDSALLLASLATHAGDRVDLLAVDTHTRANAEARSKRALPKLLTTLAGLTPSLVETDFGRVVAEVLALERKRALVVLFTSLDPGALGEGLLPALPRLIARHTVVLAAVHDPALDALAAARDDIGSLHTAAAAERGLAELRRVRSALSRHGVHVIDEPAETFASVVADTYLNLKAAGRL